MRDKSVLDRWEFMEPLRIGGDNRFHVLAALHGAIEIICEPEMPPLQLGDSLLLPADHPRCFLIPEGPTTLVDVYLP